MKGLCYFLILVVPTPLAIGGTMEETTVDLLSLTENDTMETG